MTEPTAQNADYGRAAYERWCEWNRIAPPLVLDWDELSDEQRKPFLPARNDGSGA